MINFRQLKRHKIRGKDDVIMKTKLLLSISFSLALGFSHAQTAPDQQNQTENVQENIISHRVMMGETVSLLAKKYKMTPQDIYEYNPEAVEGISQNMALRIPLHRQVDLSMPKVEKDVYIKKTEVAANTSPNKIKEVNAGTDFKEATVATATQPAKNKVTETIAQSAPASAATAQHNNAVTAAPATVATNPATHEVKPGETLFGLSRKYNITVAELTAANEKMLKRGLQSGQKLKIPAATIVTAPAETQVAAAEIPVSNEELPKLQTEEAVTPTEAPATIAESSVIEHKVESGETLTGLARKYNTTIDEITTANKGKLKHGLQTGQVIKIKSNTSNY